MFTATMTVTMWYDVTS